MAVHASPQSSEVERLGFRPNTNGTNTMGPLVIGEGTVFLRHNTAPWDRALIGWERSQSGWVPTDGFRYYSQTPISTAFAHSLKISDGRLFVGSPQADGFGKVHVVEKEAGSFPIFVDSSTVIPSPFGATSSGWGSALDVSGPWLLVSGPLVNGSVHDYEGRVAVFREGPAGYTLHSILAPPPQSVVDHQMTFGVRMAIDGEYLAVGSWSQGSSVLSTVFVYEYDDVLDEWQMQQAIMDPLGPIASQFGFGLDLSGDVLAIGHARGGSFVLANGVTHIYERDELGAWLPKAVVRASNEAGNSDGGNMFGWSIALEDGLLAVGARRAKGSTDTIGDGGVYIYRRRSDGTWPLTEDLRYATDQPGIYSFGQKVAMDGGVVAASASPFLYPDGSKLSVYLLAPGRGETVCGGQATTSGALAELRVTNMDLGYPEFVLSGAEPDTSFILLASASVVAPGPGLCLGGPLLRAGYGQVNGDGATVWGDGFVDRVANGGQWVGSVFFQVWTRSPSGEVAYSNAVEARQ